MALSDAHPLLLPVVDACVAKDAVDAVPVSRIDEAPPGIEMRVLLSRSRGSGWAVGVVTRMIMQASGWQKTGRKGSLGVRTTKNGSAPNHNTGGLAFWFIRGERYERAEGMPFISVRERCQKR